MESEIEKEVVYDGFVTPSFILANSDTKDRGQIVDPYAKTEEQDGLICGAWSKGMDGLIHIYLMKPISAFIDERFGWVNKKILLKQPISYMPPDGSKVEGIEETSPKKTTITKPKQKVVYDPETKQFRLEM